MEGSDITAFARLHLITQVYDCRHRSSSTHWLDKAWYCLLKLAYDAPSLASWMFTASPGSNISRVSVVGASRTLISRRTTACNLAATACIPNSLSGLQSKPSRKSRMSAGHRRSARPLGRAKESTNCNTSQNSSIELHHFRHMAAMPGIVWRGRKVAG